MAEVRLQKLLSERGVASRRKAEELIEQGRVKVNGRVAKLGDKADDRRGPLSWWPANGWAGRKRRCTSCSTSPAAISPP